MLISPAILLVTFLVGYGLLMSFLESIHYRQSPGLQVYLELLQQNSFIDSFLYSFRISIVSTCVSVIIGLVLVRITYPLLQRSFPKLVVWLPLLFPHFVWGYMLFLLFSQTGIGNNFPIQFKDQFGSGIILTYVWKEVPFVILMLLPVYEQLSHAKRELVYTLGGKGWAVLRHVEWPYVFPVLLETFFIIFAFVFSAYEVPALLGVTYPKMVSVLSYDWFFSSDWTKQPYAFAAMIVTTVMIVAFVWITFALTRKSRRHLHQTSGDRSRNIDQGHHSKPVFLFITLMTVVPAVFVILTSFTGGHILPDFFTTRAWRTLLIHEPGLWEAIFTSIGISLFVLFLNLLVGIPAAKGLAFYELKGKSLIETFVLSPLLIPTLAVAMGIHLTFIRLGIANHWAGVVIVHLLPTLPYTIKILRSGYERVGMKQEELAVSLGASPFHVFYSVYLPQLMPSIRSTVFLVTVISLGQYLLTAFIGGGSVITVALLYFPFFQSADDAIIASFSLLFAIIPIIIWLVIEAFFRIIIPYRIR